LRTEKGIKYGDTIDHVDFAYLAKMTKLNVAALAAIASAPPPPEPKVEGAVSTDTKVSWKPIAAADRYIIRWRRTDANQWQQSATVSFGTQEQVALFMDIAATNGGIGYSGVASVGKTLKGIRVDDWVFGVSSVSKDGFESPVASAVPGGAFHPYIAREKK
jgi:hypothetical protein